MGNELKLRMNLKEQSLRSWPSGRYAYVDAVLGLYATDVLSYPFRYSFIYWTFYNFQSK